MTLCMGILMHHTAIQPTVFIAIATMGQSVYKNLEAFARTTTLDLIFNRELTAFQIIIKLASKIQELFAIILTLFLGAILPIIQMSASPRTV